MKSKRVLILLSVVGMAVAVMSWATANAVNNAQARKTSVAVVSVGEVFNGMTEKSHVEADLQKKAEDLERLKEEKSGEIRDLQAELQLLKQDSPEWKAKAEEAQRKVFTLKAELEFRAAKLNRDNVLLKESLYRKILAATAQVAQSEGYDIVLFKESEPHFPTDKPQQVNALVELRKVMYASPDLDITDKVMTVVNNNFKAGQ